MLPAHPAAASLRALSRVSGGRAQPDRPCNVRNTVLLLLLLAALPAGCGGEAPPAAPAPSPAPAPADPELEAARVLLRHEKARIDGVMPPPSWPPPESVRHVDRFTWVVDIDTSQLPGGYPEQLAVEVTAAGGHTARTPR